MEKMTFSINSDMKYQIFTLAQKRLLSASNLMRQIVNDYFERENDSDEQTNGKPYADDDAFDP